MTFVASGCASSVSVGEWQRGLVQYVRTEGNGDPSVLRDMTWNDEQPGFAVIAKNYPYESTDAIGVLLGHPRVGDRPWFVYLVGQVKKDRVEDIRLAALSVRDGKYRWVLSDRDKDMVRRYRGTKEAVGRERFPKRKTLPVTYTSFPSEDDAFALDVSDDGRVTATHPLSGAQWTVQLPANAKGNAGAAASAVAAPGAPGDR
jgi:hypothetical protein